MTDKKLKKIFYITLIVCILIIVVEAIYFGYKKYKFEMNNTYYDNYNMTIKDKDNLVSVGSSYFKYSKNNKYTDGIEKGKLIKFDKNNEIIFEYQYDKELRSTFTSVVSVDDGYIVTGSGEYSEYQHENNLRDAFIIKFDKDGNKLWEKYYGQLANTRFNKAILVSDGIIVIGTSLYENMEVGNHTNGGGIIVKYDFDGNEIWHNNHGGNKTGSFNDVIVINNDIYVCGKDGADSGNIVKYTSDGKYVWHKNYSFTDGKGHQALTYFNDKIYVATSKKILEDEKAEKRITTNTEALILEYDLKGNLTNEVTIGGKSYERLTGITYINNNLYVIGTTSSTKDFLKVELQESEEDLTTGMILKFDKNLKLIDKKSLGGTNNDNLTNVMLFDNTLYISGSSVSKDGNISTKENNNKDYFGRIIKMDKDLKFEVIK